MTFSHIEHSSGQRRGDKATLGSVIIHPSDVLITVMTHLKGVISTAQLQRNTECFCFDSVLPSSSTSAQLSSAQFSSVLLLFWKLC